MKSRFQLLALSASFALTLVLGGCAEDNNTSLQKSGAAVGGPAANNNLPTGGADYAKQAKGLAKQNDPMQSAKYKQSQGGQ
jgi:hypothetical protein